MLTKNMICSLRAKTQRLNAFAKRLDSIISEVHFFFVRQSKLRCVDGI